MRKLLRSLVEKTVPSRWLSPVVAKRSRKHQAYVLRTLGIAEVADAFIAKHGLQVRYGPFAGMRYTAAAAKNRLIVPKLLGTYECELHAIMAQVQRAGYDTIVDVGCGEGYYTTGLALTTKAGIVAFDAESEELKFAHAMADANGVAERIEFRRWCSPEELIRIAGETGRLFVLSDCEGYEIELFSEAAVAALSKADILIEMHRGVKAELMRRLEKSHALEVVVFDRANRGRRAELDEMPAEDRERAVDECRFPQEWLWTQAKSNK
jgi:precorrin-6B methylase 2